MLTRDNLCAIRERYGKEYLLRQAAEECSELSVAAHHYIRVERKETSMTMEDAKRDLIEELADTAIMTDCIMRAILSHEERIRVNEMIDAKSNRMVNRLLGGDWDD